MNRNSFIELIQQRVKKIALSFALLLTFQGIAQIPTASLIAYYPFCGSANDLSGNGLNGTVMGATLTTDRFGNANSAYTFDGISDYIDLPPTSFLGLNIYSYSMWIQPSSNITNAGVLAYSIGGNDLYCQSLSFNPTYMAPYYNVLGAGSYNYGSNPVQSYVLSGTLPTSTWMHVVVTRDTNYLNMYVNGVLISTNTGSTSGQNAYYGYTSPYKAVIGTRSNLQSIYFFKGEIDDVRMYSTVLSQNDVNALYAETPGMSVSNGTICLGNSFTLTPAGAASYTYSSGSAIVTPTATTSYTVFGTVSSGCYYAVSTVEIGVLPVFITGSPVVCKGQAEVLSAAGAVNYTWSTGSTASSITTAPPTNTVYSVAGRDAQGCSGSDSISVSVAPLPVITISGSSLTCNGQSAVLSASGAVNYTWSTGSTASAMTDVPLMNTIYSVTGSDTLGCLDSASFSVSVHPLPVIAISGPSLICTGQADVFSASGAVNYTWSTGSTASSITAVSLINTTYSVAGKDSLGCSGSASVSVSVNPLPVIAISGSSLICKGHAVVLGAGGAINYTWSTGSTASSITAVPLINTTYSVAGKDSTGCSGSAGFNVSVDPLPVIIVSGPLLICEGQAVVLSVSGAVNYVWSTGSTASSITAVPLINTTYSVTGSDVLGCSSVKILNVSVDPLPVIAVSGSSLICKGQAVVLGASGAVNYTWSTGSTASSISAVPLTNTTYSVSGSDVLGCSNSVSVNVLVDPLPVIAISGSSLICRGQAVVLSAGGAANYTWSTGSTASSITAVPLINTTYTVTGSDAQGCSGSARISLIVAICEGVDQQQTGEQVFSVYPNPNAGSFTIKLSALDKRDCQFILTDMQGRLLRSFKLETDESLIDLRSEIMPGCYFGELFINAKFNSTQKIIIRE